MRGRCKKTLLFFTIELVTLCTGCKVHRTESQIREFYNLSEANSISITREDAAIEEYKWKEEDFRSFFVDYFSFTDEELLRLNQNLKQTEEVYWEHLEKYYLPLIDKRIGSYLEDELREQIKWGYRSETIDLPKWLLINGYMVSGSGQVDDIEIENTTVQNNQMIYEVRVTANHAIFPVQQVIEQSHAEGDSYMTESKADLEEETLALQSMMVENDIQDYWFDHNEDRMKLQQSFWITVNNGIDEFKICQIHTSAPWEVISEAKQSILNTQHIKRLPYYEKVSREEKEVLVKLLTILFEKEIHDYKYYENAYDSGYGLFQKMWEEWQLEEVVKIGEEDYLTAFPKSISPYKDQVKSLEADQSHIVIQPSLYSTLKQSRFIVEIPVRALLYNHQIVCYNYKYFVGMKENKVEFMQFLSMKQLK